MISCQLKHLAARCLQRGYTLDEVRACIVAQDGDQITVDETHPAYPRTQKPTATKPDITRTDAPSFLAKLKNFAVASATHVATGMQLATEEEIQRRFSICQGCEFLKENACTQCGCPVVREKKFISKLSWADSNCPVGKWGNSK
jgi:hypothetical protein